VYKRQAVLAALGAYGEHGRVHLADGVDDLRAAMVDAYLDARAAYGSDGVLMLASTRADARTLNRLARQALAERGELTGVGMRIRSAGRTVECRVGDPVLVMANDYGRGLFNGTRGVVVAADGHQVTMRTGARDVLLPRDWVAAGVLEHGYALTCHRAQGVTVDVALLYASRVLSRESGYVGLSRGRVANHLFATWEALAPEVDLDCDRPTESGPVAAERVGLTEAALVARLEARSAQRLAGELAVGTARRWWAAPLPAQRGRRLGR